MARHLRLIVASLLALVTIGAVVLLSGLPTTSGTPPHATSPAQTPTGSAAAAPPSPGARLLPVVEAVGFSGSGDISDDSAIWVDQANPANSVVIADNKAASGGGVGVFGMDGKL
ncbi:MAG TPA: phytase, partial [Arthrobacter sp.]|nr:phytase [Arthrobacter sp.]